MFTNKYTNIISLTSTKVALTSKLEDYIMVIIDGLWITAKNAASTKLQLIFVCFFHQKNAEICYEALLRIPELKPVMPCGAMYMMVSSL